MAQGQVAAAPLESGLSAFGTSPETQVAVVITHTPSGFTSRLVHLLVELDSEVSEAETDLDTDARDRPRQETVIQSVTTTGL